MRKPIIAFLLGSIFILTGCKNLGDTNTKVCKEEQETDYSSLYAEIISLDGLKNKDFQSEINIMFQKDVEDAITLFDSLALEAHAQLPAGVKSILRITQYVKRNKNDVISLIYEHYIYTGGAHGTASWYPFTIYVSEGNPKILTLADLFTKDNYIERLNKIIDTMIEENPDIYSELWEEPHITADNKNRFYMTDTELVIFFPPYGLSYFANGFVEFKIPLEELYDILDERYK